MGHDHDSDDLKILGDLKTPAPVEFGGFPTMDYDQTKGDLR